MTTDTILAAIGSTEESSFNEFCSALKGDCPEQGNKADWRELFQSIRDLERDGLIEVSRTDNKIDSMILTPAGADRIRAKMDANRGLFASL